MEAAEYQRMFEAEDRHFWFVGSREVVLRLARPFVGEKARVLDVGCGTGGTLGRMPQGWARCGIDLSPLALGYARGRGETVLRGNAEALPFPGGRFDAVFALDVLEHCADERRVASELLRVLRPGGALVLSVPALELLWSEHDEALHHHRRYHRPRLLAVLEEAGFAVERSTYFNSLLFAPIALVRLGQRLFRPRRRAGVAASQVRLPPAPLNALLAGLFKLEAPLLGRLDFPIGVSLLALARRRS